MSLYIGLETRSDCVFMLYLLCYCSKLSLLYRTTGDLKWLCVHVRYVLCYCSKSISLLYRTTGDLKWLCVHVRYVLCYCSKSISLLYRMVAAWWIMQGKSVACTLLQLFNKVSIIVQVPTAPVSGTSSSWAVERTIVVCVLEKLMFIRFLLLRKRIRSRLLQ